MSEIPVEIPADAELYSVHFYYEDETSFSFYSEWVRFKLEYESEWRKLGRFRFEEFWAEAILGKSSARFIHFEDVVQWQTEEDDDKEDWQRQNEEPTFRLATLTIDLHRVAAIRQVYWNPGDERPGFREP